MAGYSVKKKVEPKERKYNEAKEQSYQSMIFAILVILCALLLFNGCKTVTEYQKEYVYTTDTLYQKVLQKDSVYVQDSIVIKMKGDTMYLDRWHTKYVEKLIHDTLYKSKTDSVYIDVIKEKDLSRKERIGMFLTDLSIGLAVILIIWLVFKLRKWLG